MMGFLSWLNFPGSSLTDSQTSIWPTVTLSLAPPLWMDYSFRLLLALPTSVLCCEFESQRQCLSSSLQWLQWEQTGWEQLPAFLPAIRPYQEHLVFSVWLTTSRDIVSLLLLAFVFQSTRAGENSLRIWGLQSCYQSGILFTVLR